MLIWVINSNYLLLLDLDDDDDDDEFPTLGAYSTSNNHSTNINNHLANEYNNYSDTLESVKLPCEFCLEMIDSENLVLHEVSLIISYNVLCLVSVIISWLIFCRLDAVQI